jgi:hypothetical protein
MSTQSDLGSSSSTNAKGAFSEALAKIASLPRAEAQKRAESLPATPVSRNQRYKYVPAKPPQKS